MQLDISEIKLPNPGVLKTRIPVRVFAELTADLQNQLNNDLPEYNTSLAGHLEKEYGYTITDSFKQCVVALFEDYRKRFDFYPENDYVIDHDVWINLQKKNEYNPIHYHYKDISWVLWVTIPYDLKDEINAPHAKQSNSNVASKFQFIYNKLDGGIELYNIDVDQTYEGCLIMFPAYLKHCVYPFQTSEEYRISIAGNVQVLK